MDPKSKAEELKDGEAEYDKAFEEMANGKEPEPEAKPEEKKPEEPAAPDAAAAAAAQKPPEEEKLEEAPAPAAKTEEPKGTEKALKDTKAWATKVSQENAELKKKMLEYESGRATGKEVQDAKDALATSQDELSKKAEKVYEDYPELKDLLGPLMDMVKNVSAETKDLKNASAEEKKRSELRSNFEQNIEPEILKVHADFKAIKVDDEYFSWAEKQSPALKVAAMHSLDPRDIIQAVTEFKKFKGSPEAANKKTDDEKRKQAMKDNLSSTRGTGSDSGSRTGQAKANENDYDAAFEEATKKLARK